MTDTCTTRAIRCFSGHAVRRCLERGISALHVEQALEQGVLGESSDVRRLIACVKAEIEQTESEGTEKLAE